MGAPDDVDGAADLAGDEDSGVVEDLYAGAFAPGEVAEVGEHAVELGQSEGHALGHAHAEQGFHGVDAG